MANKAYQHGMLLVAAAGNDGYGVDTVNYPAGYANVIAVGAIDQQYRRASFSSTGPEVELTAPGVQIYSAELDGYGIIALFNFKISYKQLKRIASWKVSDDFWARVEPLIPRAANGKPCPRASLAALAQCTGTSWSGRRRVCLMPYGTTACWNTTSSKALAGNGRAWMGRWSKRRWRWNRWAGTRPTGGKKGSKRSVLTDEKGVP